MRDVLAITKALADSHRLRILCALTRGELCVCQIVELLRLAPSTVSKHLSVLYQARLIEARKDGRWMYYRLPDRAGANLGIVGALSWVCESLAANPQIRADTRNLKAILCLAPEVLCHDQMKRSKSCSSARATRVGAKWRKDGRGT